MKIWVLLSCSFFYAYRSAIAQQSGVIIGKLPQLSLSLGTDRLGSAKAGYIDTGIHVLVADSNSTQYRLQLSANRSAFIAKDLIRLTADSVINQPALMESWTVRGGEKWDTVSIGLSRPIPYMSWMETNPATIVVELFGVQSNTNWITQLSSAKGIKDVSWRQTEDDVVQVTIQLHQQQHLGYTIAYQGRRLLLSVRRKPSHASLKNWVVAIDAGHGGTNTGASGLKTGILEKNYTIEFARELEKLLTKKGVQVMMTRQHDTTIDNKDRVLNLQTTLPDLLISFHLNSSSKQTVRGVSTYYRHIAFRPITQFILDELLEIKSLPEFGNVGSFNFQLVQPTDYPGCLVEVAFLSNEEDEKLIQQKSFREKVAQKVFNGIANWVRQID